MNDDYDTITINLYSVPLDSSEYFYLKYTHQKAVVCI